MTFLAKATLIIIAFWCTTSWLWDLQVQHPWRAAAIVLVAFACVLVIEFRKGNR